MQQSASNPRFQRPALAGILLLALILRLPGLSLGLPEFCNGDEEKLNERSVRMVHQWTWDPGSQNYPALMFDLAAAVDLAAVLIPQVRAVIHLESWASFRDWIARQPLPLGLTVWLGRLLSLVCGLASLWLFYYVVRLHADPGAALGATALMATAPVHQWLSDLFKTDTLLLLAVLLCLHAGYRIGQRARPRDYVLAAVGLGLALAIKFYFLAAIPILAGAFLHRLEQPGQARAGYRRLALALLAGFLLFALLSPYSLIHWRQALRWIALESASQAGAIPMLKRTTGRLWHAPGLFMLTAVYPLALGIPLYLLALLGLPDLFRLSRPAKYVWVAFAASLFVIYSLGSKLASPHIYFIHLPALCLAAGLRLRRGFATAKPSRQIFWAAVLVGVAAYSSLLVDCHLRAEDRSLRAAADFLRRRIPPGAYTAVLTPYQADATQFADSIKFYPYIQLTPQNLKTFHPEFVVVHQGWYRMVRDNPENMDIAYRTYPELAAGRLGYHQVWEHNEPFFQQRLYGLLLPDLNDCYSFAAFQRNQPAGAP